MGANSKAIRQAPGADKLYRFVVHITFLAIWRSVSALGAPFGRLLAFYLWCGKSLCRFIAEIQRLICRTLGWLATPAFPRHSWLRALNRTYFPIDIKRWHIGLAIIVVTSLTTKLISNWRESLDSKLQRKRVLKRRMQSAPSYAEWKILAKELDKLEGHDPRETQLRWKRETKHYDRKLLQDKLTHLRKVRGTGNVKDMMFALRTDLIRNVGNIASSLQQQHEHHLSVPEPIVRYIDEVKEQLQMVASWSEDELTPDEKMNFFRETRHAFGRTALLLSGGGGLGTFHIGVVKALFEHGLLPRVMAGSSVGSIVSAIVGTRTDDELRDIFNHLDEFDISFFNNNKAVEFVQHFLTKGTLQDINYLIKKLRSLIGDMTFQDAYERTGRMLNVTVCPADTNEPPRLLNHLTAPHALIWSAVAASSAFPGLFPAQHLTARNNRGEYVRFSAQATNDSLERRWRDGSLEADLPVENLKEMFNCNHFLVSQCNPHIVPLLNLKKRLNRKVANLLEAELKHRCQQLQWVLPEWIPSRWLMLFTQAWEGDLNMVLPVGIWEMGKALMNPTTPELMRAVKQGEVSTWEKLYAIECNCAIEATLDECLAQVTNSMKGRPLSKMGNRIPSWLHMPSLGVPAVASWGSLQDEGDAKASWGDHNVDLLQLPPRISEERERSSYSPTDYASDSDDRLSRSFSDILTFSQVDCTDNSSALWRDLFIPLASSSAALDTNSLDFIAT